MPSPRGTPPAANQDMILGEMRGQLREVVHSMNNLTQKFDGLTREVIGLAGLGSIVAALQASVAELEKDRDRRDGATGIIGTLLKSPLIGWTVGLAFAGLAVLKGWIRP